MITCDTTGLADDIHDAWTGTVGIRERLGLLDFARQWVLGDAEDDHGSPVTYSLDGDPVQRAILQAIADPRYSDIAIAGCVQSGKTTVGDVLPVAHAMAHGQGGVVLAGTRKEEADAIWLRKLIPGLERSGLSDLLPQEGAGSRRGVPDSVVTSTGITVYIRGSGGANEAQMASITAKLVVVTEVDAIALSTRKARRQRGAEAQRKIELWSQRRANYMGRGGCMIIESTIKDDHDSLILHYVAQGSDGRLHVPCLHCGAYHLRDWKLVQYDTTDEDAAAETVGIVCPHCGAVSGSEQASEAVSLGLVVHRGQHIETGSRIASGQVVGPMPPGSRWSILYSALECPRRPLSELARLHLRAQQARDQRGSHGAMRQFHRDHLTRQYRDSAHGVEAITHVPAGLASRSAESTYRQGELPWWPGVVAIGIDVQLRELYWTTLLLDASPDSERVAIIDWGVEYLCHKHEQPAPGARFAALERIRARGIEGWSTCAGQHLSAQFIGVDVGGRGWLAEIDSWLQHTGHGCWAMRGAETARVANRDRPGTSIVAQPGWYEHFARDDGRQLLMADGEQIKGRIHRGLAVRVDHPSAWLLPQGVTADSYLVRNLLAETQVLDDDGKLIWKQTYPRNDYLDTSTYGAAGGRYVLDAIAASATSTTASDYAAAAARGGAS